MNGILSPPMPLLAGDEAILRATLARKPRDADALFALGALLARQKRYVEAILKLESAATARPDDAAVRVELGQALRGVGRNVQAQAHFDHAAALHPADEAVQHLALLHQATLYDEQGNSDAALAAFTQATERFPDSADAWAGLGMVQMHTVGPAEAEQSFRRTLQLDGERPIIIERFGQVLQEQRQLEDAALVFERLFQRWPAAPYVPGRLLHVKMLMGDWLGLDTLQAHVEQGLGQGRLTSEPFGLQGYCARPELLRRCAELSIARGYADQSKLLPRPRIGSGPKIRIGYLCGEFRNQATSVLLTEALECHDPERFQVYAFDNGWDDGSELRRRIEAAVTVVPIARMDNMQASVAIRELQVDVLVNLNGFFGRSRTNVFSMRPAAVQVNYLGFPGTMGASYIDYLIADAIVIPAADRQHYAEKVVHLPDSYQPNDSKRRIADGVTRADAGLPDDAFVYTCMNNVYKIVPRVFDVWMRLLANTPGSVLLLLSELPETHANLRYEAEQRGVDPRRILFGVPWANERHLARLALCDLFLDTWPYNAHTTGSDALWAGLPMITCTGATFPSRVGASLLRAVGLPELVTDRFEDYEALALRLAGDRPRLAALRSRLARRETSALYDMPRYTRHLEAAYTIMVDRARRGLKPEAFAVAPIG